MATKSYTLEKMQKIHLTILFLTDCIPKFFGNTGLFRTQKIFSSKKKKILKWWLPSQVEAYLIQFLFNSEAYFVQLLIISPP